MCIGLVCVWSYVELVSVYRADLCGWSYVELVSVYRAGLCGWSYVELLSVYRAVYAYGSGPLWILLLCVYVCGQVSK